MPQIGWILRRIAILLAVATLIANPFMASPCDASKPSHEGARHFALFIQSASGSDELIAPPFEPFTLLLSMRSSYALPGVLGTCTLGLDPGLAWVRGDTIHVAHVSQYWRGEADNLWNVTLRATRLGNSEIRGSMTSPSRDGQIDEMDIVLPIMVEADRVRFGRFQVVRQETVRKGQRYRYGGRFLVPIDSPERLAVGDIKKQASVRFQEAAECSTYSGEPRELRFVAFVRSSGLLHSYRLIEGYDRTAKASPEMVEAAERALKRWEFSPAKTLTRTVADWLFVRVPVHGVAASP